MFKKIIMHVVKQKKSKKCEIIQIYYLLHNYVDQLL